MDESIQDLLEEARGFFEQANEKCRSCGRCAKRCNLLTDRGWNVHSFYDISLRLVRHALEATDPVAAARQDLADHPDVYSFMRTCAACDRCTCACSSGLRMTEAWGRWRGMLRACGVLTDADAKMVSVDKTWDLFSVFRAVQGISFEDLPMLRTTPIDADESEVSGIPEAPRGDTLFFAGCSLVSYAPELTRDALNWLNDQGLKALLATQCCGSPLFTVGESDRARSWRKTILSAARAQGVRRIVTVCPGCAWQLRMAAAQDFPDIEFVALPRLLADAGIKVPSTAFGPQEAPLMFADSCHDRDGEHGSALRKIFADVPSVSCSCSGRDALCCGAGGGVEAFDPQVARTRTRLLMSMARDSGARSLLCACPTCAYTYANETRRCAIEKDDSFKGIAGLHYLEAVFGRRIDWPATFAALERMWTGEYAEWVAYTLT